MSCARLIYATIRYILNGREVIIWLGCVCLSKVFWKLFSLIFGVWHMLVNLKSFVNETSVA